MKSPGTGFETLKNVSPETYWNGSAGLRDQCGKRIIKTITRLKSRYLKNAKVNADGTQDFQIFQNYSGTYLQLSRDTGDFAKHGGIHLFIMNITIEIFVDQQMV